MKNASVQQPHSMKPLPFPLSSRAYPDFLLHSSHQRHLCGSRQREPHAFDRSHNSRQEIRGSRGICSSADPSWKCFSTELSCAFGPPKVMKNAFCPRPLSMEAPPSPCHLDRSAAQWRDLCVDAPSWKCFRPSVTQWSDLRFSALGPGNSPMSTRYVVCYFIHCASMTMLSPLLTLIVKRSTCASPRAHPDRLRSSLTL